MKKVMLVIFSLLIFALTGCTSGEAAINEIISSYQYMSDIQTEDFTIYDEGEMFGDAYYVIGEANSYITSVNYYKGEYIYIHIEFDENTMIDGLVINQIMIEYCDYEKEIYISTVATNDHPYVNEDMDYETLFALVKDLSIQDMRGVLKTLDIL